MQFGKLLWGARNFARFWIYEFLELAILIILNWTLVNSKELDASIVGNLGDLVLDDNDDSGKTNDDLDKTSDNFFNECIALLN